MRKIKKIKAGVLFYAIIISLIIAIFSGSLILYSFFNKVEFDSMLQMQKVQANAASAINLALSAQALSTETREVIDLFGSGSDSVIIRKKSWGAFEIAIAKAFTGNYQYTKSALLGSLPQQENDFALYLADRDRPLNLAGNTIINGTCFLPKAGIKRAYIEGTSFTGSLSESQIRQSDKEVPAIHKELLARLSRLSDLNTIAEDSIIDAGELRDTLVNSFFESPLYVYSSGSFALESKSLQGNIVVISEGTISVKASASLNDIIIYAPEIIFEEGFEGTLQAFASDSLVVKKDCKLKYPSVLAVLRNPSSSDNITLTMEEGSELSGMLIAYQEEKDFKKSAKANIEKKALVKGSVYTNSSLDLKGSVYGNVTTNTFLLNTASSVYENHLLNATIDPTKLSPHFVGAALTSEGGLRKIIKWL